MSDDIDEFVEATKKYEETKKWGGQIGSDKPETSPAIRKNEVTVEHRKPGEVCQYYRHFDGFMPTTETIQNLPPGCYELCVDQQGIYAVPTLPSVGLLLELPEMRSEEVVKMSDTFWNSEKDYKEGNEFVRGGAAFKMGVMLYGPPGTGKSCTVKILSNKIVDRGGTVFFANISPECINGFLTKFATIENNRKCIVILEDLDSLIRNFGESGYLNMLDSAQSIDNVFFIATTNYPDRLDPRIYNRPGRFSHVVKIGLPVPKAREAFLKAILKNHKDVGYIVEHSEGFSIDHLSALVNAVYREKKSLKDEIDRLRRLFNIPKSEEERPIGIRQ